MAGPIEKIGEAAGEAAGTIPENVGPLAETLGGFGDGATGGIEKELTGHSAGEDVGKQAAKTEKEAGKEAGRAAEKPLKEALSATEKFVLQVALNSVLLLAGLFLIVYGVMVAVRPRESAMSIPVPRVMPIPV